MFGTQAVAVIVFLTIPVMATEIAPVFAVEAKDIGVFMSIVFTAAMVVSAASGSVIRRWGGVRAIQFGMSFSACCLVLCLFGSLPLLFLAAVLVGVGYGPNTPAGAHVLARVTRPEIRGLVFSVKQSGAPLGGLIAGFLIPAVVTHVSWQAAIALTILIAITTALLIQPLRAALDDDRKPSSPIVFASPWLAIRKVWSQLPLRRLTMVAFCLTTLQAIILTFLIVILVQEVQLEYTVAGAIFGAAQAAGAILRIVMGWFADVVLGTRLCLVCLGLASAVALVLLPHLTPATPFVFVVGLSIAAGALSFGWNGVFLAEVVNLADPEDVGAATGGSLFFLYAGIVFGPLLTSTLVSFSGSFVLPLTVVAVATIMASINLLRVGKAR